MCGNKRSKKGFAMIYVILYMSLITLCLTCFLNIESIKRSYLKDTLKYELASNEYEKHREYLLAKANKFILENSSEINDETVDALFSKIKDREIQYNNSYLQYDRDKKNIVIFLKPYAHKTNMKECYSCKVQSSNDNKNKVCFYYLGT